MKRSVFQISKSGIIIRMFTSVLSASKDTGISSNDIIKCCNNKAEFAGGFKWAFAD